MKMEKTMEAYVVFSGQADLPWLKILKPRFRHCAVLINDGQRWMTLDPLSSYMDVTVHEVPPAFNLPLWMEDRGHIVVKTQMQRPMHPAPWGLFTCVEAVKRTLGIHNRFIITPWQLFKFFEKQTYHTSSFPRMSEAQVKRRESICEFAKQILFPGSRVSKQASPAHGMTI